MGTRIAATNIQVLVVLGLAQALDASGYVVEATDDPFTWAGSHPGEAMLVGVREDEGLDLLRDLGTAAPSMVLVAVLDPPSRQRLDMCIAAGARACASMDWSGEDVTLALDAGRKGMALLPASMARDLTVTKNKLSHARDLTSSQQSWLMRLASGLTIHDLAEQVGFSERETYRRLRQIYETMGVRGRMEALIVASASGLLDGPPSGRTAEQLSARD